MNSLTIIWHPRMRYRPQKRWFTRDKNPAIQLLMLFLLLSVLGVEIESCRWRFWSSAYLRGIYTPNGSNTASGSMVR
jgi:hypothetical protein